MQSDRIAGSLLGGMIGDVAGAVVEGESPRYIRKAFKSVDDLLALESVEEILNQKWTVGRFTDDTQMTICVAEWLLENPERDGKNLLARFSEAYRPARRYGPSTARILEAYPEHHAEWRSLATLAFADGSYGNGSAMRVGPVGCVFGDRPEELARVARISSVVTHCHPLAVQGAVLQAMAVSAALRGADVLGESRPASGPFAARLAAIEDGLRDRRHPSEMAEVLGTGIDALEAVPMALYCFLANPDSFEDVIQDAIFLGGDTDTIAGMAGTLAGARLGVQAIPRRWLARVREETYTPGRLLRLAGELAIR